MPETHQPRIEHALTLLEREETFVTDERAAFERFKARVDGLEPTSVSPATASNPGGDTMARIGAAARPDTTARSVRTAYEETVLSVPHYAEEYGEPAEANFAAELGPEVAAQVFETGRVTPPVYETIRSATEQAIDERSTFTETLRTERESLRTVRDRLDEYESRAAELGRAITDADGRRLSDIDDELAALEAACTDLATTRQDLLHGRTTATLVGITAENLVQFLYAECDATCPALADITDCIDTIRRQRERCLR